jgi:hypothetical protein
MAIAFHRLASPTWVKDGRRDSRRQIHQHLHSGRREPIIGALVYGVRVEYIRGVDRA